MRLRAPRLTTSMVPALHPRAQAQGLQHITTGLRRYSAPVAGSIPPSKQRFVPKDGTYPKGFLASGTHVGVKPSNIRRPDLALIVSESPCSAAAVFTQNRFQAAPVVISKDTLQTSGGRDVRALVVNSGCANAVTGKGGLEDAAAMKKAVEDCMASDAGRESSPGKALVMSTGVIGQRLPTQKIVSRIPLAHSYLSSDHASWLSAATAICTTDTFPKLSSRQFRLPSSPDRTYRLAGMTKGAGMIHPDMATLLGILCTDAPVSPDALQALLAYAMARSFNSISVDGDTSTNDTVALLANGAAGGPAITAASPTDDPSSTSQDYVVFRDVLTAFAADLAKLVVRDGEGATKFVTIRVTAATSESSAHAIASSIATSPLVKTALYGKDANWGRVLCAIGYTPSLPPGTIVPEQTSVSLVPVDGSPELKLLVDGEPESLDEDRAKEILEQEDLEILVRLRSSSSSSSIETLDGHDPPAVHEACYYTCDFSHEYVTINGDYRT